MRNYPCSMKSSFAARFLQITKNQNVKFCLNRVFKLMCELFHEQFFQRVGETGNLVTTQSLTEVTETSVEWKKKQINRNLPSHLSESLFQSLHLWGVLRVKRTVVSHVIKRHSGERLYGSLETIKTFLKLFFCFVFCALSKPPEIPTRLLMETKPVFPGKDASFIKMQRVPLGSKKPRVLLLVESASRFT